jgi:hypothetical protein
MTFRLKVNESCFSHTTSHLNIYHMCENVIHTLNSNISSACDSPTLKLSTYSSYITPLIVKSTITKELGSA